ncbi:MAG: hypothetical protein O2877_03090 [bacterium]|nr:hypothetical protein [bacterium]
MPNFNTRGLVRMLCGILFAYLLLWGLASWAQSQNATIEVLVLGVGSAVVQFFPQANKYPADWVVLMFIAWMTIVVPVGILAIITISSLGRSIVTQGMGWIIGVYTLICFFTLVLGWMWVIILWVIGVVAVGAEIAFLYRWYTNP